MFLITFYLARNSRLIKKENKSLSESRIPSLAAIDLHASSIALHQVQNCARRRRGQGSLRLCVLWGDLPLGIGQVSYDLFGL